MNNSEVKKRFSRSDSALLKLINHFARFLLFSLRCPTCACSIDEKQRLQLRLPLLQLHCVLMAGKMVEKVRMENWRIVCFSQWKHFHCSECCLSILAGSKNRNWSDYRKEHNDGEWGTRWHLLGGFFQRAAHCSELKLEPKWDMYCFRIQPVAIFSFPARIRMRLMSMCRRFSIRNR